MLVPVGIDNYTPFDPTTILADDSAAILIYYRYDNNEVDSAFRDNAHRLQIIHDAITSLLADNTKQLALIRIVGSSSVEGAEAYNATLSLQRARALASYLKERYNFTDNQLEILSIGEGWSNFRYMIANTALDVLPQRDALLNIINSTSNLYLRERKLKDYGNGRAWHYITRHILPYQRNAGYLVIYFRHTQPQAN